MSLLKEIQANAAVAWSPVKRRAELLALGSKGDGGVGFENNGGEFKLVAMDLSDPSRGMVTLGSVKTASRFTSLAWRDVPRHHDTCPYGIIAGGMADGSVSLWNPALMLDREPGTDAPASCEIGRITRHKGAVNALQFNPHEDSAHLLASGGSDGEVYIMSLEKLASPGVFTPGGPTTPQAQVNEITSVAWNTQVNYILATGSQNGTVVVWDLKQKKPWCELRDPARGAATAIAWNPNEGLQIATASGDDQHPSVKLWDLRNSTSTPLAEFHDHTAGVLSMSWCPNDPGLLLSCDKDNRTLLWDLFSRKTVAELPSDAPNAPQMGSDQFFGGGLAGQRRWNVQWSPQVPAVALTCSLDGKLQVWGLSGGGNPACRPPKWMRRPAGASFGFGGKLVTIANPQEPAAPNGDHRRFIHMQRVVSDTGLVAEAEALDRSLETKDFKGHCEQKIAAAATAEERSVWSFMKILFEKDARQHLLLHLGLDAEKINELNAKFNPEAAAAQNAATAPLAADPAQGPGPHVDPVTGALLSDRIDSGMGAEDVFSSGFHPNGGDQTAAAASPASPLSDVSALAAALPSPLEEDKSKRLDAVPAPVYTEESENTLMQALLVGNFEVAVNCCLAYNQLADALLLASCGGPELWEKTQRAFFAHQQRPVMRVVSAIIKNELTELVDVSDLAEWRETLAILSTYAKSEEFPSLCDKLATRLEAAGDLHSATLCFMCAVNVEKTVNAWCKESEVEARTHGHTFALHRLVEKVSVFAMAVDQPDQSMGPEVAQRFAEYASLMAAEGRLDIAAKYARFPDLSCAILKDRIYNAYPMQGYQPPPFPFDVVQIQTQAQIQQQQEQQQHQQQRQAAAQQQQQQQQRGGYGSKPSYGAARNQYGAPAAPTPAPAAAPMPTPGGFGAQNTGYQPQQHTPTPTPAYPGRPGGYQSAPQQPGYPGAGLPPQHQQPGVYQNQQQPGYPGQATPSPYPSNPAPGQSVAPPFPGQPQQPPQQPGYSRPQQPGFAGQQPPQPGFPSGPPSSSGSRSHPQMYSGPPSTGATAHMPGMPSPAYAGAPRPGTGFGPPAATSASPAIPQASLSPLASAAPKAGGFPPDVVPGSTENVGPQDLPIVNAFNDLVSQLQGLPLTMMEQKQLQEIQKGKEIMFTKLNIGELSSEVVSRLHEMVACFGQRDFGSAQGIYVALTASDWAQHKDWLRGLKSLIHISMKRFR
ncbi:Protein transport protein SEC31 B [Phytophthora fragariae]|uniref:Protein transport protein SEC31 n=1 Tax=Phytophthora fragariae TaxID=53985 RepID=A0A6G0QZ40_9STRA|nr:Protein transport protein SEC31 B [Phytophthora fragariae]